ncbi:MAG: prepilin-type N-terminal cleavage/methylation domain-containing protein [Candidatus Omnitrophica bacterium]|nr:prepilin-type N-terminal cleavage/methylation domain-containing protein [Candidatus Omnitrophota bacterium]
MSSLTRPHKPQQKSRKIHGFTIIEILISLAVTMVLLGISFAYFNGMQDHGKILQVKKELITLQSAVESYAAENQGMPPDNITTDLTSASPQIISASLVDPFAANGTDTYQYTKNGKYYAISSVGMDRKANTEAVQASGSVSSDGDDHVKTNGTALALNPSSGGTSSSSGTPSGGGGGGSAAASKTIVPLDPQTEGGWSFIASSGGSGAVVEAGLESAMNILKDSVSAGYAYDLIQLLKIPVSWATMDAQTGAFFMPANPPPGTISVNDTFKGMAPETLAALLAHEATHADYFNYADTWTEKTLLRHPELTASDIHIINPPYNSIDQEYNAMCNQARLWKETKGSLTDANNDGWLAAFNQGPEALKEDIRRIYASLDLPEY